MEPIAQGLLQGFNICLNSRRRQVIESWHALILRRRSSDNVSRPENVYIPPEPSTITEESTVPGKFELYKDKGGKFRFRLKASNGQIILASQGYKTTLSANNGVGSVQRNSAADARFERKSSKGKFMFNLKATNGQVVGTSERYESEKPCENGIKSVAKNAPGAKIEDLTT
jgi:uncharacterized protein YegP (UPF0339 family)